VTYTLDHTDPLNCSCGAKPELTHDDFGHTVGCNDCADVDYYSHASSPHGAADAWLLWHEMRIDELLTAEGRGKQ